MRGHRVRIEVQCLAELRDGLGAVFREQEQPSAVGVDDDRQRIQRERLSASAIASGSRPSVARYPSLALIVRERRCRIERDAFLELALGSRPLPVEPEFDLAERHVRLGQFGVQRQRVLGGRLRFRQ